MCFTILCSIQREVNVTFILRAYGILEGTKCWPKNTNPREIYNSPHIEIILKRLRNFKPILSRLVIIKNVIHIFITIFGGTSFDKFYAFLLDTSKTVGQRLTNEQVGKW